MDVKKFFAPTMEEALAKVRKELGEDAVILETKSFPQEQLSGLYKEEMIEVTAANDINVLDPPQSGSYLESSPDRERFEDVTRTEPGAIGSESDMYREIIWELGEIRSTMKDVSQRGGGDALPQALLEYRHRLVQSVVDEDIVRQLLDAVCEKLSLKDLQNEALVHDRLCQEIATFVRVTGPIKGASGGAKIVAVVGPTGTGKTTTVSKLATQYSVEERKRVGLVSADTYRIAAVEQLRVFAEIVGLPLEVAMTPAEVRTVVEKYKDMDIVFVDTAGRSPFNERHMKELKGLMAALGSHETHLVISATTQLQEAKNIIDRFRTVGIDNLIFSKLDESQRHGIVLSAAAYVDKPISYLTTGQAVPEDIEVADGQWIARLLVDTRTP